ncbi:MAG: hypothetical protein GQ574_18605 [Crocinitomix sp.]|nr:hypothetical protein [Crocinitomix sp.]
MLYPYKKNNQYGLIDKDGKIITPTKYEYVDHFSEGLIGVDEIMTYRHLFIKKRTRSIFSYIDILGNTIIQDVNIISGQPFSEGLAFTRFKKEEKDGFINKEGEIVIPPIFESQFALGFSEGLANIRINNKYGFINKKAEEIIPFKYDSAAEFHDGFALVKNRSKKSFIDKKGNKLKTLKCIIDDSTYGGFKEQLAVISVSKKSGIININGDLVIDPIYDMLGGFNEGLCPARKNNVYGYLNPSGEYAIEPKFANALDFRNGVAPATLDKKQWGLINTKGEFILPPSFDYIQPFGEDDYTYSKANTWPLTLAHQGQSKYYINAEGETILEYESKEDKQKFQNEMLETAFRKKVKAQEIWDKAKWAHDGVMITKKGAVKPFYFLLKWLLEKNLLTTEGETIYQDKNNLDICIARFMVTDLAADFLDRYYKVWFETEAIANFQIDPDMSFENNENLDIYWEFYLSKRNEQ